MATMLTIFFVLERTSIRYPLLILIFLTFLSGYLYTKYQTIKRFFPYILGFDAICFIICSIIIFKHHHYETFPRWLLIVLLGLGYNSKFLTTWVRNWPFAKIFYVALVWALVNSWLIVPNFQWDLFAITFLFVSALILPFDIRDVNRDTVATFPSVFGIQKSKYLAYLLLTASSLIASYTLQTDFAISYFITLIFAFIFIYFSSTKRNDLYFSFGVESLSGLPLVLYWLIKLF